MAKLEWTYNGMRYQLGDCITEPHSDRLQMRDGRPLVWHKGRIFILTQLSSSRCCLRNVRHNSRLWAKKDQVFQVLFIP